MSKFLHRDAIHLTSQDDDSGFDSAERLGIQWPELPWRCPGCNIPFTTHGITIATLDVERYEHPEETTFRCVGCDLAAHFGFQNLNSK